MYNVARWNKNSHLSTKTRRGFRTITMSNDCPIIKRRENPIGTTNRAITANRLGKVHLTNAVAVEPREKECTLGTNALHAA